MSYISKAQQTSALDMKSALSDGRDTGYTLFCMSCVAGLSYAIEAGLEDYCLVIRGIEMQRENVIGRQASSAEEGWDWVRFHICFMNTNSG